MEAVHLQHVLMGHDPAANVLPGPGHHVVGGVDGVDADARQDDPVLGGHLVGDVPLQLVQAARRHAVRHLDVHRADEQVRAVVVEDQIVGPLDLGELRHGLLHRQADLAVHPLPHDAGEGLPQHIKAGFQDHHGDDGGQPGLHGDFALADEEDQGRRQGGGGDHGVVPGVLAGGHQGVGVHALAGLLHVEAQGQLHRHRHGDDDQGHGAVVRGLRVKDLLHRLHQGGDAGVEDDDRDHRGRNVLGAAVAVGMLLVRLPPGQLGADDGNDGGQGVGEVVHRVHHHGDGVGEQAHGGLEARQQQIRQDPQNACAHDHL